MSHGGGWAGRYQFLEEVWRGAERVILDGDLEAALREGGPGVAHGSHPPLRDLVDDLIPREPESERVWMAVGNSEAAGELARLRGGTRFVSRARAATLLRTEAWEVAMLDLGVYLRRDDAPAPDGEPRRRDRSGRFLPSGAPTRADPGALDPEGVELVERAASAVRDGRHTAVLFAPVREFPSQPHGFTLDEISDLVTDKFGGGRVFGCFAPPMTAIVSFGRVSDGLEPGDGDGDGDEDGDEDGDADGDEDGDEVELSYDNTLGTQEPGFATWIVVAGSDAPLGDGLTLLELPPGPVRSTAATGDADADDRGMRAQLAQASRQTDLAAIERQQLIEQVDTLVAQRQTLEEEVTDLHDRLARMASGGDALAGFTSTASAGEPSDSEPGEVVDAAERLDAVLAREQSLRWRVSQLERELDVARKRPVDQLEAELASLRVRAGIDPGQPTAAVAATGPATVSPPARSPRAAPAAPGVDVHNPTRALARERAARELERIVRRVEREGIGALELRRELVAIRRLLRN